MNKKGQMAGLASGAIAVIVLIFVVVVGTNLVQTVYTSQGGQGTNGSVTSNLSYAGLYGLATYQSWFGIVVLIIIASVIIALLMRSFGGSMGGQ